MNGLNGRLTLLPAPEPYPTPAEDTLRDRWHASLGEWMRHNDELHPDGIETPCADCRRHEQEEARRFARVRRALGGGL